MFARKWPLISSIALAAVLLTPFGISAQNTSSGEQQADARKLIREDEEKRVYETDEVIVVDIKNPKEAEDSMEKYLELKRRGELDKLREDNMIRKKSRDEVPTKSNGPAEEPSGEPVTFPGQLPDDFNPREYENPIPDPSVKDRPGISDQSLKKNE